MALKDRERQPPAYRVTIAWGPYSKGHIIRPTGAYRDALLERRVIELAEAPVAAPREAEAIGLRRRQRGAV
jgi:hypothetical protein